MVDEAPVGPVVDSSSPAAQPETTAPSPTPQESAPVSTGDPGQSKTSLLDAVLKVVPATTEPDVLAKPKDQAAPPEAATPPVEDQATSETDDTGQDDDDEPPAEAAPAVRKKVNKLLRQRRELRNQVAAMQGPAEIGSQIQSFVQEHNLTADDFANTLRIAALAKAGDYRGFYEAVAPFVRSAQEYLGIVLPNELAQRVRAGQMTEVAARDFARQQYDIERAQSDRRDLEVAHSNQQRQYVQNDVQRAVSTLEYRMAASDPDYKAKAPAVKRAAQAILFERGGAINSVEEALDITNAAYNEVNRHYRSIQPRPVATRPALNGASQTPSARAAPKTLMEAALQGLENSRRTGG